MIEASVGGPVSRLAGQGDGRVSHELLHDVRFWEHLLRIDEDLCATARKAGCPDCGGRLDRADFPRKPRGGPAELPEGYERRLSLCCDRCRKRVTPASVRFLGRRVYLAAVMVLVSVMRSGPTPGKVARLEELFGVDRRTVKRWRRWWLEAFVVTPFWRAKRARLMPPVDEAELPASLLARFCGELEERLCLLLEFLSPLTTASAGSRW